MCLVVGCDRESVSGGLCRKHYDLRRNHGSATPIRLSRACLMCNTFFETSRRDKKFCSQKCRDAFRYQRRKNPVLDGREANPLHAVNWFEESPEPRLVVPVSVFTFSDVVARQDGVCAACGERLASSDPLSGEAAVGSWRVAPAEGGAPVFENRIAVHRRCLRR